MQADKHDKRNDVHAFVHIHMEGEKRGPFIYSTVLKAGGTMQVI